MDILRGLSEDMKIVKESQIELKMEISDTRTEMERNKKELLRKINKPSSNNVVKDSPLFNIIESKRFFIHKFL